MLLIIAYLATIFAYFRLTRRYPHKRLVIDVIIVIVVLFVTSGARFCFLEIPEISTPTNGWETYLFLESRVLMTIYTGLGTFQFDISPI